MIFVQWGLRVIIMDMIGRVRPMRRRYMLSEREIAKCKGFSRDTLEKRLCAKVNEPPKCRRASTSTKPHAARGDAAVSAQSRRQGVIGYRFYPHHLPGQGDLNQRSAGCNRRLVSFVHPRPPVSSMGRNNPIFENGDYWSAADSLGVSGPLSFTLDFGYRR